ncbi:4-alpha-glucanotransferase [Allostella sp. ATCC 35155]|nr:4-alpha-glucanotransferase [Stella sp. ATCC 35155]
MSDRALRGLARRAGVQVDWTDYRSVAHSVAPATLRRILAAFGLPAETTAEIRQARAVLGGSQSRSVTPPLVTADAGCAIAVGGDLPVGTRGTFELEDGSRRDATIAAGADGNGELPGLAEPGYHRFVADRRAVAIAVAPERGVGVVEATGRARSWGLAAQIYSLPRDGDGGTGDFGAVAILAEAAARHGASAVALSPAHALFAAEPRRAGPYSPSSRLFLNVLYGDPGLIPELGSALELPAPPAGGLIDWGEAGTRRLAALRRIFAALPAEPDDFRRFRATAGPALEDHARFEALHAHQLATGGGWSWRSWPAPLRDARGPAVAAFAAEHADEVRFHAFLQWVAHRSRAAAQARARAAGMGIGLIADLAVGMDGDGSHAWSRPADLMTGLSVGAPPDLINGFGQNWGLTTFSPPALVNGGFAPFLATLRAAMADAGGVRIDHVMGLSRLWVIPEGGTAGDGAYVHFPVGDLLRLAVLESHRHRAVVIGEDLGTVAPGFRGRLSRRGIHGMRVLWFERRGETMRSPATWTRDAVAMTTTHDLPTVAGWWRAEDVRLRREIAGDAADPDEPAQRVADRTRLWQAMTKSGTAAGPQPEDATPVVDAALRHVAASRCQLMLLPVEDALALGEQPNLPGTIDEHPNWRRRLPSHVDTLLDAPDVATRLQAVDRARR